MKLFQNISCILIFASLWAACGKEPTLAEQLTGKWKSEKILFNGIDISAVTTYEFDLKNGSEIISTQKSSLQADIQKTGTWVTDEFNQRVSITFPGEQTETWQIIDFTREDILSVEKNVNNEVTSILFHRQ